MGEGYGNRDNIIISIGMVVTYHLYLLIVIKEISSCVASLHLSLSEAPFSGRLEGKGEKVRGMTE